MRSRVPTVALVVRSTKSTKPSTREHVHRELVELLDEDPLREVTRAVEGQRGIRLSLVTLTLKRKRDPHGRKASNRGEPTSYEGPTDDQPDPVNEQRDRHDVNQHVHRVLVEVRVVVLHRGKDTAAPARKSRVSGCGVRQLRGQALEDRSLDDRGEAVVDVELGLLQDYVRRALVGCTPVCFGDG